MNLAEEKGRVTMRARGVGCEMDSRRSAWELAQLATWRGQVNGVSRKPVSQVSRSILSRGKWKKKVSIQCGSE